MNTISIKTPSRIACIDITSKIQDIVTQNEIKSGICTVFIPHTTAGITINENADPDVTADIIKQLNRIVPFEADYSHIEGNSAAHIKASLFGFSVQVIIDKGKLVLGTWQGIYLCEFDGPRTRQVFIKTMKD